MKHTITLQIKPSDISKYHVVYILYDPETAVVAHVGQCRLSQLFALPDARQAGIDPSEDVLLTMTDMFENRGEAVKAHSVRMKEYNFTPTPTTHSKIECIETGEKFGTIAQVAEAHGIAASNLSNHLRNNLGYNTVKGKTYRRVTP